MVKKICSCSKNIEHGQNIFELADGIGNNVSAHDDVMTCSLQTLKIN